MLKRLRQCPVLQASRLSRQVYAGCASLPARAPGGCSRSARSCFGSNTNCPQKAGLAISDSVAGRRNLPFISWGQVLAPSLGPSLIVTMIMDGDTIILRRCHTKAVVRVRGALFCKSGIPDLPECSRRAAGAIAQCLRRAFFRTPYGILASIESTSPNLAPRLGP
jgi:hypothetical protein